MDAGYNLRIEADLAQLAPVRLFVEEKANALKANPEVIPDLQIAVTEIVTNIIVHGYQNERGVIELEMTRAGNRLMIRLRGSAPLFNPTTIPRPDVRAPLEERPIGGMGIFLVKDLMGDVTYRVTPEGGNELTLVKKL